MNRFILAAACAACAAAAARADGPTVVRLTVDAAPVPRPALRYELLPPIHETHIGNAALGYLRAFSPESFAWTRRDDLPEKLEAWLDMPLEELPDEDIPHDTSLVRMIDFAARYDSIDWQMQALLERDGFGTLLPDIQGLRELARWVSLRARVALKRNDFDGAIRAVQTKLAMARHLGEHPSLIGNLVGLWIAGLAAERLDEIVSRPGCPNLYWALAALPDPPVELKRAIHTETLVIRAEFGDIIDPTKPWSAGDENRHLERLAALNWGLFSDADSEVTSGEELVARWRELAKSDALAAGKGVLREAGVGAELLARMPAVQVVILADYFRFLDYFHRYTALLNLPYHQAEGPIAQIEKELSREVEPHRMFTPGGVPDSIFLNILPSLNKVRLSQLRVQQRLGLLRCVEAVRAYAAAHDGKLPDSLEATGLPVPLDPANGRPFRYDREGDKAVIRNAPLLGQEGVARMDVRYEVRAR